MSETSRGMQEHEYLPDFALGDDVDPGFAFVASQSDIAGRNGNPLYTAQITFIHRLTSRPENFRQHSGNCGVSPQENAGALRNSLPA